MCLSGDMRLPRCRHILSPFLCQLMFSFYWQKTAASKVIFAAVNRFTYWGHDKVKGVGEGGRAFLLLELTYDPCDPFTPPNRFEGSIFVTSYLGQILRLNNQIQFNYSNQRFQSYFFQLFSLFFFFWSFYLFLLFFFWQFSSKGLVR